MEKMPGLETCRTGTQEESGQVNMESPRGTKEDRTLEERNAEGSWEGGGGRERPAEKDGQPQQHRGMRVPGAERAPEAFSGGGHMGRSRSQMGRAGDRTGRSEGEAAGT